MRLKHKDHLVCGVTLITKSKSYETKNILIQPFNPWAYFC